MNCKNKIPCDKGKIKDDNVVKKSDKQNGR